MRDDFREEQSSGHDPLDARRQDFDWEGVFAALDGPTPPALRDEAERLAATAVRRILEWLLRPRYRQANGEALLGRRLIAFAWTLDPRLVGSSTLAEIARDIQRNKESLSCHAAQAHRDFGVRNRIQDRGWNWRPAPPEADATHEKEGNP